jgi:plasmid maintenance system antidote protein VapI
LQAGTPFESTKTVCQIPYLLNSKANLSGDMALRIEKDFGVKMDTLMRMRSSYDIVKMRKRENRIRVPRISLLAITH